MLCLASARFHQRFSPFIQQIIAPDLARSAFQTGEFQRYVPKINIYVSSVITFSSSRNSYGNIFSQELEICFYIIDIYNSRRP